MFDDFKVANYSKSLVSPELYARPLSRILSGDVIDGLTVTPGTGLQVVLAPGNTFIRYGSGAVASARIVSLVNNFNLTIGTADVSNPRHDLVVVYIDNAVSLPSGTPTSANLDGKGVAKAKIVQGTPASSPSDPNSTAIQTSVGAGNPYTVVARVRVNAGVSVIAGNLISDARVSAKLPSRSLGFLLGSAETVIGEYGGLPLYEKFIVTTVDFGTSGNKTIPHGIVGLSTMVTCVCAISLSNDSIFQLLPYTEAAQRVGASYGNTDIILSPSFAWGPNRPIRISLRYTKA